jgi:hypothetical protein
VLGLNILLENPSDALLKRPGFLFHIYCISGKELECMNVTWGGGGGQDRKCNNRAFPAYTVIWVKFFFNF